jgi:AcrR family transcriptional regulator
VPRWEPNARLRLVESALELFEQQGYDETSVAQIAERAGLTKTTFFRQFSDKREVLFAGQEDHCTVLYEAAAGAPADATPLQAVGMALDALVATGLAERRDFAARVTAVVDAHSDLQERAALKRAGYVDALTAALHQRAVPEPTTAVAADLGILAFYTAFGRWVRGEAASALPALVRETLRELHEAGAALR